MPRRNSGPRLWLRPAEQGKAGGIERLPQWHIKDDGGIRRPVGCFARDVRGFEGEARQQAVDFNESEHAKAQQALAQYIVAKHRPTIQKGRGASDVSVLDVLLLWGERVVPTLATAAKTAQRLVQLGEFWAGKTLADVDGDSVDAYVDWRCKQTWKSARPDETGNAARMVKPQGARRELEDLRAAINWHRGRGYHREIIEIPLPPKGRPKETHLERHEAARLLLQMWRCREVMTVRRNTPRAGEKVTSRKRPQVHLTRFTLLGIYTGTRAGAIATAAFDRIEGRSWLDLDTGMFHRLAVGKAKSNKRQPPVRLPDRLLAHIRRWKRLGFSNEFVVEFHGQPVVQVNKGFGVALEAAGLQGSPHMLRHTCATWLLQRGVRSWDAANYLGMSERILLETYGHWAADFQVGIAGGRRRARPEAELHDVFSTYYNREVDLTIARRARAARLARRVPMESNAA